MLAQWWKILMTIWENLGTSSTWWVCLHGHFCWNAFFCNEWKPITKLENYVLTLKYVCSIMGNLTKLQWGCFLPNKILPSVNKSESFRDCNTGTHQNDMRRTFFRSIPTSQAVILQWDDLSNFEDDVLSVLQNLVS